MGLVTAVGEHVVESIPSQALMGLGVSAPMDTARASESDSAPACKELRDRAADE